MRSLQLLVVVVVLLAASEASMAPLMGLSGQASSDFGKLSPNNFDSVVDDSSVFMQEMVDNNVNSLMDIMLGDQHTSEKNALHHAVDQRMPSSMRVQSPHASHSSHHPHSYHSHAHPQSHHSYHHSRHHHMAAHHQAPHHHSHGAPTQVADVIEQLEVDGDTTSAPATARPNPVPAPQMPQPNPHLRDQLVKADHDMRSSGHSEHSHDHSHDHDHHHHHEDHEEHSSHHGRHGHEAAPAKKEEEDDVPYDEFGLKKDCHWIQMDFTQHSDNCNQCMTVADAYFRGDDVCACYKDKGGNPMRQKCNEMAQKFKDNEDHIRELAIENQWNDYFKSYGLCENFGHCGV